MDELNSRRLLNKHLLSLSIVCMVCCMTTLTQAQEQVIQRIEFSGYTWGIKHTPEPAGPGPNHFSHEPTEVWVDDDGFLHLRLHERDGRWLSSEIISGWPVGYGTYEFRLAPGAEHLDPNVVLGLFTWDHHTWATDANSEIDIELTRWAEVDAPNLHYSVHPTRGVEGQRHRERYRAETIDLHGEGSTHVIRWTPDRITCSSYIGDQGPDADRLIAAWSYDASNPPRTTGNPEGKVTGPITIPRPSPTTSVRINLWLLNADRQGLGDPPTDGQPVEVILTGFSYTPFVAD